MKPAAAAIAILAAAGCHRQHCDAGARSKLELHDAAGATTLSWKGQDLCDGQLRRVATLEVKGGTVTLKQPDGRLRLELAKESPSVAQGRDQEGPTLRLYRDEHELRVLRGDGVPFGSIIPDGKRAAVIYDPAQAQLAKVAMHDRDAVVTNMSGATLESLVPAKDAAPAGVFGIPHLDPVEQQAIYIYWSK